MSHTERITWASTELQFTSADTVTLADGGTVRLVPVAELVRCPEQLARVQRKHRVALSDLVPVETTAAGIERRHYKQAVRA